MDVFRIHHAVGIARVGNSAEYIIAPETMAGRPVSKGSPLTGGLPIRAGTESDPVRNTDLRDGPRALKRHAARFRIFAYPDRKPESWPRGDGVEVKIGDVAGGRTVANIIWTVHVANKKANTFYLDDSKGPVIDTYSHGPDGLPVIRNADINKTEPPLKAPQPPDKIAFLNDPTRVRQLTIDPGPRVVSGRSATPVRFDKATTAAYFDAVKADIVTLEKYPNAPKTMIATVVPRRIFATFP